MNAPTLTWSMSRIVEFLDLLLLELGEQLGVELVAGFGVDLAVFEIDDVLGDDSGRRDPRTRPALP